MIIRSQDKKRIVNFNNVEKIGVYGRFENALDKEPNIWTVETPTAQLGQYSSPEKAIKVLDMIQDNYAKLDCVHHGVYIHGDCVSVFQMPQDEEVEV
jgi:hypothetical protein